MNWGDVSTGAVGAILLVLACAWLRSWLRRELLEIEGIDSKTSPVMKASHAVRKDLP